MQSFGSLQIIPNKTSQWNNQTIVAQLSDNSNYITGRKYLYYNVTNMLHHVFVVTFSTFYTFKYLLY